MTFDPKNTTTSGLERFAQAVDKVMQADDLTTRERIDLIGFWAYRFARPDMPKQLDAAIKRCNSEPVHPTASSIIDAISGEVVCFSGPPSTTPWR